MADTIDIVAKIIIFFICIGGIYEIIKSVISMSDYHWAIIGMLVGVVILIIAYLKIKS